MIGARVENLLELDYPADKLQLVVASDASTDRTHEIVTRLRTAACGCSSASAAGKLADD